jgi:mRNA-degrading endonuclease RelE of RelBE toxin-antitoxin system
MNYSVEVTSPFKNQAKRLLKKYPSLKSELSLLFQNLETNPKQGTALKNNCFKIRLAIASKGKGKSGGARVITHVQVIRSKVYLLSIYDKSEQSTISDKDLDVWLNLIP